MSDENLETSVKEIVAAGRDVRARIRETWLDAAGRASETGGISGLVRRAVDAAADGVRKSVPDDPASVLRQVIDGLGDGLSTAAHATRLALREAADQGRAFAADDVRRLEDDLGTVASMFTTTVADAAGRVSSLVSSQAKDLAEHARRTMSTVRPDLDAAVAAARKEPGRLVQESAEAGVEMTRRAAGSLLAAIGGFFAEAGRIVSGSRRNGSS